MKAWCMGVVCAVLLGAPASAQTPQVRPLDGVTAVAFEQGLRQSEAFRSLVSALEASDLIVHVVTTRDLVSQVAGVTRFVTHQGTWRYVRIDLSAALTPKSRISVLAHELQHAVEIADSGACSPGAVLALYRTMGMKAPTLPNGWETTAAVEVERHVWTELGRASKSTRASTGVR